MGGHPATKPTINLQSFNVLDEGQPEEVFVAVINRGSQSYMLASPYSPGADSDVITIPTGYSGVPFSLEPEITGDCFINSFNNTWPLSSFVAPLPTVSAVSIVDSNLSSRVEEGDTYYFGTAKLVVRLGDEEFAVPINVDFNGIAVG